jgi:hypothetical protein
MGIIQKPKRKVISDNLCHPNSSYWLTVLLNGQGSELLHGRKCRPGVQWPSDAGVTRLPFSEGPSRMLDAVFCSNSSRNLQSHGWCPVITLCWESKMWYGYGLRNSTLAYKAFTFSMMTSFLCRAGPRFWEVMREPDILGFRGGWVARERRPDTCHHHKGAALTLLVTETHLPLEEFRCSHWGRISSKDHEVE